MRGFLSPANLRKVSKGRKPILMKRVTLMGRLLDLVNSPKDIKKINDKELNVSAKEIRGFLINSVSKT